MAMLPTGIIVVPTGTDKTITPIEVKGGVMIGTTDATDTAAGNPITETFPFKDNGVAPGLSAPKESTSANSTSNAKKPFTSGTFAYNQVQFMIRNVATKINNTESNALLIGGQSENLPHENTRNGQIGAKIGQAFRYAHWPNPFKKNVFYWACKRISSIRLTNRQYVGCCRSCYFRNL